MSRPTDLDFEMALCIGLGMTDEEARKHLDISPELYDERLSKGGKVFEKWKTKAQQIAAKTVSLRVAQAEAAAVADDARIERMKTLFDRGLTQTERLMEQVENGALGGDISLETLQQIHDSITRWAAPFVVAEKPKKVEVDNTLTIQASPIMEDTAKGLLELLSHVHGYQKFIDVTPGSNAAITH